MAVWLRLFSHKKMPGSGGTRTGQLLELNEVIMPELNIISNKSIGIYNFDGQQIRAIVRDGEPWFFASDVCDVLSISNSRDATSRLDEDEKGVATADTLGGTQQVAVINESGLYSLILTSRKPEAKRFKKWVTSEVLPSIRKTGSYAQAAAPAIALPKTFAAALRLAAEQQEQIEAQQAQLALAAPKVAFVERYVESTGLKGFREVCKLLGANEARFREFLIDNKIMYRLGSSLTAYATHLDAGRFEVRAGTSDATGHAFNTCKFTPKGVEWVAGEWAKHNVRQEATA